MITRENVSIASLLEVLKTAYVEASLDSDGDILTREDFRVYTQVPSASDSIRFMAQFSSNDTATREALLEFANRVNAQLRLPRVYIVFPEGDGPRSAVFDHYVYIDAGLEESSFVSSLRRFHRSLRATIDLDTENALK